MRLLRDFSGFVKSESLLKTATLALFDVNISAETAPTAGFGGSPKTTSGPSLSRSGSRAAAILELAVGVSPR